jgi:hypothetical protein
MLIPNKHSGYQAGIRLYPGGKGGGGSSAPPPDPALIAAQIKSMGYQDAAIQQIMQTSADMAPLQKEQLKFGLDSAKTAYGQSQDDRTYALGRRGILTGLQDTAVNDARDFNTDARREQLASEATADVSSAFAGARDQQTRAMARMGVNPNSGRALAMGNQTTIAQAGVQAGAANKTRAAARAEGYALNDRAANGLSGAAAMGMQTTGSGAGIGASGITMANTGLAGLNSGAATAGGVAGQMGGNAASMYGAMGGYKNGAEASKGDGGAGMIVGLAGAAATAY